MMLNRITRFAIAAGVAAGLAIATDATEVYHSVTASLSSTRSAAQPDQAVQKVSSGYLISSGRDGEEG